MPEKGKRPIGIPSNPNIIYADDGWVDMKDWLGMESRRKINWRPFEEAREFVRSLELPGQREWVQYCQGKIPEKSPRPNDIPTNPNGIYGDQYLGLADWLRKPSYDNPLAITPDQIESANKWQIGGK